ncbi:unnamed protein product [Gordionus sp. m RMFG-2023]|uniref:uncharacterized protein LOC135923638 n=1 Tax=Gordionus sp. m RMFG-2023 TaxID=3053472 RepID=UPI0030DE2154
MSQILNLNTTQNPNSMWGSTINSNERIGITSSKLPEINSLKNLNSTINYPILSYSPNIEEICPEDDESIDYSREMKDLKSLSDLNKIYQFIPVQSSQPNNRLSLQHQLAVCDVFPPNRRQYRSTSFALPSSLKSSYDQQDTQQSNEYASSVLDRRMYRQEDEESILKRQPELTSFKKRLSLIPYNVALYNNTPKIRTLSPILSEFKHNQSPHPKTGTEENTTEQILGTSSKQDGYFIVTSANISSENQTDSNVHLFEAKSLSDTTIESKLMEKSGDDDILNRSKLYSSKIYNDNPACTKIDVPVITIDTVSTPINSLLYPTFPHFHSVSYSKHDGSADIVYSRQIRKGSYSPLLQTRTDRSGSIQYPSPTNKFIYERTPSLEKLLSIT